MTALAALVSAVLPFGVACHSNIAHGAQAQLDGDRALESVLWVEVNGCPHTQFGSIVTVSDTCGGRRTRVTVLDEVGRLGGVRAANADGWTKREEILYVTSTSARLVQFVGRHAGCTQPRVLFDYVPSVGPGGIGPAFFSVDLRDASMAFRGLELQVTEDFLPSNAPSVRRTTLYRYDRAGRVYVAYATEPRRL